MKNIFRKKKKNTAQQQKHSVRKWDPLFIIFEKHLYDFNYESREAFLKNVTEEYMKYLAKQNVTVPASWRLHFEKSIGEEVSDMLVRKLYGCLNVQEFKHKEEETGNLPTSKKESRKRYMKLVG